jgi:hypothetical protein
VGSDKMKCFQSFVSLTRAWAKQTRVCKQITCFSLLTLSHRRGSWCESKPYSPSVFYDNEIRSLLPLSHGRRSTSPECFPSFHEDNGMLLLVCLFHTQTRAWVNNPTIFFVFSDKNIMLLSFYFYAMNMKSSTNVEEPHPPCNAIRHTTACLSHVCIWVSFMLLGEY